MLRTKAYLLLMGLSLVAGQFYSSKEELFALPLMRGTEHKCPPVEDKSKLNQFHIRGANIGGFLVLEPWITPSLFYQFLGATKKWGDDARNHVALDSETFCTSLGKEEANRQLRQHWKTWVTEDYIKELSKNGADTVRVPVGDWMFVPREPFIGCWDGAHDELMRLLDLCQKYGIGALLDVHTAIGSQNGLDNSGNSGEYYWFEGENIDGSGEKALWYNHWPVRNARWMGEYNHTTKTYMTLNEGNIIHQLLVVEKIIEMYKDHPAVVAIEPVNEPWEFTPLEPLKEFYWRVYQLVRMNAPHWLSVLHASFRPKVEMWGGFMENCDHFTLDTHIYQAWYPGDFSIEVFEDGACKSGTIVESLEALGTPVIVGEWSLATDNCAMWLNGFNDNLNGYPYVECAQVLCPDPYMNTKEGAVIDGETFTSYKQPDAPPNPELPAQDPFGTGGASYVEYGYCPRGPPFSDEKDVRRRLAHMNLHSFEQGHGHFFWNFRTEMEPRWDYLQAVKEGWLPSNWNDGQVVEDIKTVCDKWYADHDLQEKDKNNKENLASPIAIEAENNNSSAFVAFLVLVVALVAFVGVRKWFGQQKEGKSIFVDYMRVPAAADDKIELTDIHESSSGYYQSDSNHQTNSSARSSNSQTVRSGKGAFQFSV